MIDRRLMIGQCSHRSASAPATPAGTFWALPSTSRGGATSSLPPLPEGERRLAMAQGKSIGRYVPRLHQLRRPAHELSFNRAVTRSSKSNISIINHQRLDVAVSFSPLFQFLSLYLFSSGLVSSPSFPFHSLPPPHPGLSHRVSTP